MSWLLHQHPMHKHKAAAAGAVELLAAHMRTPSGGVVVVVNAAQHAFDVACRIFEILVGGSGHEARAVLAGALESLETRHAEHPDAELARLEIIRHLHPAAQRHDAAPCTVVGCQRCAAARASGVMCALPGCGARSRDGGAKKLLRCGTCRAACYCGAAHQREDWGRHKGACGAPPARDDAQAGGASGS
jgi:hypothetical protein